MNLKLRRITGSILLAAFFAVGLLACGKNKDKEPEAAAPAAEAGMTLETPAPAETPAADGQEAEEQGETQPFEVMDVACRASGIAAMGDGSLLVTDIYHKIVWRVKDGVSTVYAGGETVADPYGEPMGGYNDDKQEDSFFATPWAIAPFLDGWAVTDADNNAIRLIRQGKVETINARSSERLKTGPLGVVYDHPTGLAADDDGNLYVSDTHSGAVRMITPEGRISTFACELEEPTGLCWKSGTLYIAETGANRILVCADGKLEILAGSGERAYLDGAGAEAAFAGPQGIAVGSDGAVYVADTGNSAIRKIEDGQVTTVIARDRTAQNLKPVSPVGLLVRGKELYVCDSFTKKVLLIPLE